MQYGLTLPPFGAYADPRYLAEMAHIAEDVGWDGFFLWDHMFFDPTFHAIADPWVALAAVAMKTTRLRIGVLVTPLARRRPWKVARETVTLDHLSNGRLIFGAGLGSPAQWDFGFFHEETDDRRRAKKLDESLDILTGLWRAEPFCYQGEHYQIESVTFRPAPVQQPRIPVWIGGTWNLRRPLERAARYDGYIPLKWGGVISPEEWVQMRTAIEPLRAPGQAFDYVHGGFTPGGDLAKAVDQVAPYTEVGVTWWIESVDPWLFGWKWEDPLTPEATRPMDERIRQGPPRRA